MILRGFTRGGLHRALVVLISFAVVSCSRTDPMGSMSGRTGSVAFDLKLSGAATIATVTYQISGNGITPILGAIDLTVASTAHALVVGVPLGPAPFQLDLNAVSTDGKTTCAGSTTFSLTTDGMTAEASIVLACKLTSSSHTGTTDGGAPDGGVDAPAGTGGRGTGGAGTGGAGTGGSATGGARTGGSGSGGATTGGAGGGGAGPGSGGTASGGNGRSTGGANTGGSATGGQGTSTGGTGTGGNGTGGMGTGGIAATGGTGNGAGTGGTGTGGAACIPTQCAGAACNDCSFGALGNCNPDTDGCDFFASSSADRALCESIYACFANSANSCAKPLDCWCGSNGNTCTTSNAAPTKANGPCLNLVFQGSKLPVYDAPTIFQFFTDQTSPLGRAVNLTECRESYCATECSVPQR